LAVLDQTFHVVDADLDVLSGVVSVYGCTEDPGPEHQVEVRAGRYRVRVSYLPSAPPDAAMDTSGQMNSSAIG
jgi:hypothetical protein